MSLIDAEMNDLISRQAAIDAMSHLSDSICEGEAIDALCELPTIDLSEQAKHDIATIIENEMDMRVLADRKHGKWETKPFFEEVPNHVWCICPFCKNKLGVFEKGNYYQFCPVCGAKLE